MVRDYDTVGKFADVGGYGNGTARNALRHWMKFVEADGGEGVGTTPVPRKNRLPTWNPHEDKEMTEAPLNLILYGPPGSGKTYQTVERALAILEPDLLKKHDVKRADLKAAFDRYVDLGQIPESVFICHTSIVRY